jgi:5-(carboxyamino)imidazole ribonucleotide mutase
MAIGKAGAINAALLATQILALHDAKLLTAIEAFRERQTDTVLANPIPGVKA